jgi:hypothetical protein
MEAFQHWSRLFSEEETFSQQYCLQLL